MIGAVGEIAGQRQASFKVVFEGRFVPGRDRASVQKAFRTRFGETNTKAVFVGRRVTLKAGLTQKQARRFQQELEKLGMVTVVAHFVEPTARNPRPTAARWGAEGAYSVAELDAAFQGPVTAPPMSRRYLLALLPVTLSMLLMPLVYLGITLLCGYGVYWFATEQVQWAVDARGALLYLKLTGFAAVVLGGTVLTGFLLRPFLPIGARGPEPVRLEPNRERALFHLVDRIATAIGAPVPHEIWVDTEANASARLSRGVFSRRLTLTIGLPLLYGLDVQTVAGILAHEFGHFAQRWGIRASYIVNSLNLWFHRRIYERDRWDDFVDYCARNDLLAVQLAARIAGFGSWLCRRLLLALAAAARLLSLSLSRQMEFDADRYEIALVGSSQYRSTAEALRILAAGHSLAVHELAAAFNGGKLADNLPRLAVTKAESLTADDRKQILAGIARLNGSVFDTHPPDRERIERAVAANATPQFVLEGPAAGLLTEIEGLSRLATLQWYRSHGLQVTPDALQPVAGIEADSNNLARVIQTRADYFGALAELPQRLRLLPQTTLNDINDDELSASLSARLKELRKREGEFVRALKDLSSQREHQHYYGQALFLRRAGVDVSPTEFPVKLATTDPNAIERKLAVHKESEAKLRSQLTACTDLQGQRLSYALELAARQRLADRNALDRLRRIYAAVGGTEKDAEALQASVVRLDLLIRLASVFPDNAKHARDAVGEANVNEQLQASLRRELQGVPDPLTERATLADSLPRAPGNQPRHALTTLEESRRMLRQLARIGVMVDGRLAEFALAAERAVTGPNGKLDRDPKTAAR